MNPKNLRIGNLVLDCEDRSDKTIYVVSKIESQEYNSWDAGDDYNFTCRQLGTKDSYYDIKPFGVKLDDSILGLMGFKKDNSGNNWIDLHSHYLILFEAKGYFHPVFVEMPELSHEVEQRVNLVRIEFVHELQNLFFVLTGKEIDTSKFLITDNHQ